MRFKIGVFGSSAGNTELIRKKAEELGNLLSKKNVILITGGCSGIPYMVAAEAAKHGTEVWGYSPEINEVLHREYSPTDDISIYKKLIYVPKGFSFANMRKVNMKYRNVVSTATCDAGIIISGRWGSLNEFTNLIDFGKIVGVLTGTGGIADELPALTQKIKKEGVGKIIFNNSPEELVEGILHELSSET